MKTFPQFLPTVALMVLPSSARAVPVGIADSVTDAGSIGVLVGIVLIGVALAVRALRPKPVRVPR